jgi:hypothetical protein
MSRVCQVATGSGGTLNSAGAVLVSGIGNPANVGTTVTVPCSETVTDTVRSDCGCFNVTVNAGKTATFPAHAAGTYKFRCNVDQ